ncbi:MULTISPECIES: hypothetical protein [unclassified Mycolicibacterium]|uniref:hypothetical protein n=1 Tax=unclassified Mycolicibacterium TaxID=2636767 RepID=UPI001F4C308E|nr:hypothetical protein [Mycolicibacterium sp. YH-1]UNB52202.1 hypothetical protein L0M16_30805 [Mycolicibacterium sp. YH-1]
MPRGHQGRHRRTGTRAISARVLHRGHTAPQTRDGCPCAARPERPQRGYIGLWEINEAFAGVVVASTRELDLDTDNVNVNVGAVSLGHPLGASGFRLIMTPAYEIRDQSIEYGITAICGGGQRQAMLLRVPV